MHDLHIGTQGSVSGSIDAHTIDVHGVLAQHVVCHQHIMIHRDGSVSGKLDYAEIEIERGGQFMGQMTQHEANQVKSTADLTKPRPKP